MDKQTAKLVARIAENLPPEMSAEVMQAWIDGPLPLQEFLAGLINGPSSKTELKVFKRIELGTIKTVDEFRTEFVAIGGQISPYANGMIGQRQLAAVVAGTKLNLVKASVGELGLKKGATREQIYVRAKEFGLDILFVAEVLEFRKQYTEQPSGEWLIAATEPISASDGVLELFDVRRSDSGLWLRSSYGPPDRVWDPDDQFVFARRK